MKEPQARKRLTIIGTGLIGGSLGLALKAAGLESVEIVGHDLDRGAANQAQRAGAIDRAEHNLLRAVEGASMVIIATPVLAVRELMQEIAGELAEGVVVTDTASTKAQVMQWAAELLPEGVSFVGGHPMAGKETPGIEQAEATLFAGKAYCICPSLKATDGAVNSVVGLARLVGAEPLFVDAEEHDQYAAAVSHLPLLVSTALFTLLRSSPAWPDLAPMASSGFRDITRLASGDPRMSHDICVTNREAAVHWLERMAGELHRLRDMLADAQDEGLLGTFTKAQMERDSFLAQPPVRAPEAARSMDARQELINALVGGWMMDRVRKAQKLPELMRQREAAKGVEPGPDRAQRIAEDIRRDLERRRGRKEK
ncbi:MAG: prephenate dehydrogenase/arogenate dehydrogenase family protein [Chloroflexi bacterium]|nr:prephenate dehydrogenase/arogenate dehydrogenase family protein [Chloroflexota bacterium]